MCCRCQKSRPRSHRRSFEGWLLPAPRPLLVGRWFRASLQGPTDNLLREASLEHCRRKGFFEQNRTDPLIITHISPVRPPSLTICILTTFILVTTLCVVSPFTNGFAIHICNSHSLVGTFSFPIGRWSAISAFVYLRIEFKRPSNRPVS